MLDIRIDYLQLNIEDLAGQEHRIGPIVEQAAAILAARLDALSAGRGTGSRRLAGLTAPAVQLDLRGRSDEAAAVQIADSVFSALAAEMEGSG